MPEREPDPLTLKSAKYFFHEGRLQIELSDARILRVDGLPRFNLPADLLQPPGFTPARAVEHLVETAEAAVEPSIPTEGQEKRKPVEYTGRLKSQPRSGRPDGQGKPTAWAKVGVHEDGRDKSKMLSVTFHRHTADKALALPQDARITIQGYLRPSEDPKRMDSFSAFQLIDHSGSPQPEE